MEWGLTFLPWDTGQGHDKGCAAAGGFFDVNGALEPGDDGVDDGKAKAGPAGLSGT